VVSQGLLTIPVLGSTLRLSVSTATTCVLWVFQEPYFLQFAIETLAQGYSKTQDDSKTFISVSRGVFVVVTAFREAVAPIM